MRVFLKIGSRKYDMFSDEWPKTHARYEKLMFDMGTSAVKMSLENTRRIHNPEGESGIKFMRIMGYGVKAWNFITTGKFSL